MAVPGYGAYIFDLDGTLYLGDALLPGARDLVETLRERGVPLRFLSNNPTLGIADHRAKLAGLGLPVEADELVTSLVSTTRWLTGNRPDAVIYPIGEQPLLDALDEAGLRTSEDPAQVDIVLASYDRGFTYRKLQVAFDALWFHRRAVLMSTNPDRFCPFPDGRGEPDAASIVAAIEAATQVRLERTFGKPSALMAEIAMAGLGVPAADVLMVGDRLHTDIAMARRAGMAAALVLSGDSGRADIAGVPAAERPTLVVEDLRELL
ncbi:MAG: HAD-IIA family hydrolase [Propionicimonas sp.]|nr:HAD-IIA family hydrolase [Propionicimonas sp.]